MILSIHERKLDDPDLDQLVAASVAELNRRSPRPGDPGG